MTTYIALDWAQTNMAIAWVTEKGSSIKHLDLPSNLEELKIFLKQRIRGLKVLTLEETTTAHWLYTELKPFVDEIIICDPYRNRLLSDGPKTDVTDAKKLVQLLRAGLLKPVYHDGEELFKLRKLISSYNDLVQSGVRLKNQKSAIFRAQGKTVKEVVEGEIETFVVEGLDKRIAAYEKEKEGYEREFKKIVKRHKILQFIKQIPGIGLIGAVKVGAIVVTADRFPHRNNFLAYAGLVRLDKVSGGRTYGSKKPRYNREIKSVFKTAALSATTHEGKFADYYNYLRTEKRYQDHQARHAVARKIAVAVLGVLRSRRRFDPNRLGAIRMMT